MLIIFGGLPGTGKTSISQVLAQQLNACYLRVDTIEQTLKKNDPTHKQSIGPEGYLIAYALAKDNLRLGFKVVADSVNAIDITRKDWQEVAKTTQVKFLEIEIICSDAKEHKRRVETRTADIAGHTLPTWEEVMNRQYEKWHKPSLTIDTAKCSIEESIQKITKYIAQECL